MNKARHWIQPRLPYMDDAMIMEDAEPVNVCQQNTKRWVLRKSMRGLIRTDLTVNLVKTSTGFPIVRAYKGDFPKALIGLNQINKQAVSSHWLHGFSEDCVLERIWNKPYKYFEKIRAGLGGMLSPDFSLYLEMSRIEKQMNIFRKNALSQIAQNSGIKVIHTLSWGEYDSLDYCIDGVENNGIYAVSTIGINRDYISRKIFRSGLKEIVRRLTPKGLLIYGYPLDFDPGVDMVNYSNENIDRLNNLRKRK